MRTRRMVTTLLAGAGLVAGLLASGGPAAAQTATGQIVYEQGEGGGTNTTWDIWIMNADGTGQVNLTNTPDAQERDPEISPDGTKVAFISNAVTDANPDENYEVFTMNTDGSNRVQVTTTDSTGSFVQSYDPTWSPDGTKIAFSGYRANLSGSQIFTINADGTGEVNLTTSADFANKWEPDWSPDGTKILYTWGWDEFSQDLHVINPDGSGDTKLTPDTVHDAERNGQWSPDGSRIAFRWDKDCCGIYPNVNAEIYIMEYPSGAFTRVTEHDAIDEDPTWSPDGSQITFSSLRNGTYDLFVVTAPAPPAPTARATASADAAGTTAVPQPTPLNTAAGDQQDPFWGGSGGSPPPPGNHTLTATRAGAGTGVVGSNPAGIKCGTDCSESYPVGTSVTLTAKAASGSTFAGWSGACSGTASTCMVTMDAAKSVTATFITGSEPPPGPHTLTVTRDGAGRGKVTSSPAGIDCGTDCTEAYASGTSVTLSARAASDSTFAGWSGDCSGTASTCTVTMNAAKSVMATFTTGSTEPPPPSDGHTLTVTKAGAGRGKVTSSPAGIDCGTDCTEAYAWGTSVTLSARSTRDSTFAGWSGACSGTASTCTVTMNAAKSVTATFNTA